MQPTFITCNNFQLWQKYESFSNFEFKKIKVPLLLLLLLLLLLFLISKKIILKKNLMKT